MSLEDAYAQLSLDPPLAWEQRKSDSRPLGWDNEPREIGTTTQTMIEMYLDLQLANRVAGTRHRNKVQFLYVGPERDFCEELSRQFNAIHVQLRGDLALGQVRFMPQAKLHNLRGEKFYSWAIFCDHYLKETVGFSRSDGPFRFARKLEKISDNVVLVKDREGEIIGHTDKDTGQDILDARTCPMSYQISDKHKSATYPAWKIDARSLMLHRQFAL